MIPPVVMLPLPPRGPHGRPITKLVVHCMGERIRNTSDVGPTGEVPAHEWLAWKGLSAHALIRPDGTVVHCVSREQKAYHVADQNTGKLGVELLVAGAHDYTSLARAVGWDLVRWRPSEPLPPDPYTPAQYESLGWWLAQEARLADLGWAAVTSHHELQPTRKYDPGPVLHWAHLERRFTLERELAA